MRLKGIEKFTFPHVAALRPCIAIVFLLEMRANALLKDCFRHAEPHTRYKWDLDNRFTSIDYNIG